MITLGTLRDNKGARRPRVRVGRGIGSGIGKTSGKGQKGQKARTGIALKGFEGGQMPLGRRLPKRGFKSRFVTQHVIINLGTLQQAIDRGALDSKKMITYDLLSDKGLVRSGFKGLRVLAGGSLTSGIRVEALSASQKAKEMLEAQGGSLQIVASESGADLKNEEKPRKSSPKVTKNKTSK